MKYRTQIVNTLELVKDALKVAESNDKSLEVQEELDGMSIAGSLDAVIISLQAILDDDNV